MGEIADEHLDRLLDGGYGERDEYPQETECRRCGKGGLTWEHDGERWVLLNHHGEIHRCDPARIAKAVAADFDAT